MQLTEFFVRFTQFGAEWVMWVLVALSILCGTVVFERFIYFFSRRLRFARFTRQLEELLRSGNVVEAERLSRKARAPECVVAAAGLAFYKQSPEKVSEAMLSAKATERLGMESYLTVLATFGNNAPFIGLLGTVLGIIRASNDLSNAQVAKEEVSGAVMAGVFEALVATAVGLLVAIPAVIAYNYFQRRVRVRLGRVDAVAHMLLALHPDRQATIARSAPPTALPPPVTAAVESRSTVSARKK